MLLCWEVKKSCFPLLLSVRMAARLQLSWWWIPLLVRIWQFFVVNIILSASPVESLQMQIPVSAAFYDTCSCVPGRPRQVSHRGLANQDGKTRDGRTGRPAQLSVLSLVCLPSPFLPITALPFALSSVMFIAPSLSPACRLGVRWGHRTPPLPHTAASAPFCD